MSVNERRLTGRDVLAKTFQAKTKRGFDPIEVDAYLELVAAQIDVLHADVANASATSDPAVVPANVEMEQQNQELLIEVQQLRTERDEYVAQIQQFSANEQALRAENDQLRTQLTSIAPPPPLAAEVQPETLVDETQLVDDSDGRGAEESYELVLRMARRSAEETISEAHSRADEIVAEANLTASQIAKESDRKAYEAANKVQAELASVTAEIGTQQNTLRVLQAQATDQRNELRDIAQRILVIADDDGARYEGVGVVDLRENTQADSTV